MTVCDYDDEGIQSPFRFIIIQNSTNCLSTLHISYLKLVLASWQLFELAIEEVVLFWLVCLIITELLSFFNLPVQFSDCLVVSFFQFEETELEQIRWRIYDSKRSFNKREKMTAAVVAAYHSASIGSFLHFQVSIELALCFVGALIYE